MDAKTFLKLDPSTKMTLLIALSIRNEMEIFHWKYLSDTQMKELNPIIRQSIYNMLTTLKIAESSENSDYQSAAKFEISSLVQQIPDYWEFPDQDIPWDNLDELLELGI